MNTQAGAAIDAGPGGWPDPDLLIGPKVYVGGQTDEQARAQFTMWSIFPTNLLISQNVLQWSDYALETYSNAELIAINQDPLGRAARRIVGGDLPFPCHGGGGGSGSLASVVAAPCSPTDKGQIWNVDAASGLVSSAAFPGGALDDLCSTTSGATVGLFKAANGGGSCGGKNQQWKWGADGTVKSGNSGLCLDVYDWNGPVVDGEGALCAMRGVATRRATTLTVTPLRPHLFLLASPRIASHRIALHRIETHRIASHRIETHRSPRLVLRRLSLASPRLAPPLPRLASPRLASPRSFSPPVWDCNGGSNQNFTLSADGHISSHQGSQPNQPAMCLTATAQAPQTCSNVWGRLLAGGDYALGFVNNDVDSASTAITCDASCFAALLNGTAPASLKVRDLWAHADVATITPPFSWTSTVASSGFAAAYRLSPA